jgi:hypothetical protein
MSFLGCRELRSGSLPGLTTGKQNATMGRTMSPTHPPTSHRAFREAIEPYAATQAAASFVKLSISLPVDLVEVVRASAAESGTTVSATIAAALRRTVEDAEQRRLNAALSLDAEENVAWAEAAAGDHAKLLAELEW